MAQLTQAELMNGYTILSMAFRHAECDPWGHTADILLSARGVVAAELTTDNLLAAMAIADRLVETRSERRMAHRDAEWEKTMEAIRQASAK